MADIELVRGDHERLTVTVRDAGDNVVDLTSGAAWFTVKRRLSDDDDDAVIRKTDAEGVEIEDAEGGVVAVIIAPSDTADLTPGTYRYDVQVRDGEGRISTVARGRVALVADVTRAT